MMWQLLPAVLLLPCHLRAQSKALSDEPLYAIYSFEPDSESEPYRPDPPPMPKPWDPPRPAGSRDGCAPWSEWQRITCWWPDQNISDIAPACVNTPNRTSWPDFANKFVQAKSEERYTMIVNEYKKRGESPMCGYCSRSFECRARNDTDSKRQCPLKEVREIQQTCDDSQPCEMTLENGGCPPPAFLVRDRRLGNLRKLLQKGKFQDFAAQFFEISGVQVMDRRPNRGFRSYDVPENSILSDSYSTHYDESYYPNGPDAYEPDSDESETPFGLGSEGRNEQGDGLPGPPLPPSPPGWRGRSRFGPGGRGRKPFEIGGDGSFRPADGERYGPGPHSGRRGPSPPLLPPPPSSSSGKGKQFGPIGHRGPPPRPPSLGRESGFSRGEDGSYHPGRGIPFGLVPRDGGESFGLAPFASERRDNLFGPRREPFRPGLGVKKSSRLPGRGGHFMSPLSPSSERGESGLREGKPFASSGQRGRGFETSGREGRPFGPPPPTSPGEEGRVGLGEQGPFGPGPSGEGSFRAEDEPFRPGVQGKRRFGPLDTDAGRPYRPTSLFGGGQQGLRGDRPFYPATETGGEGWKPRGRYPLGPSNDYGYGHEYQDRRQERQSGFFGPGFKERRWSYESHQPYQEQPKPSPSGGRPLLLRQGGLPPFPSPPSRHSGDLNNGVYPPSSSPPMQAGPFIQGENVPTSPSSNKERLEQSQNTGTWRSDDPFRSTYGQPMIYGGVPRSRWHRRVVEFHDAPASNATWPSFAFDPQMDRRSPKKFRPPPQRHNKKLPPDAALDILNDLMHGVTCVSTGGKCLCCCGYYVPNILRTTCEDIRNIIPGIDKAYDRLTKSQKKNK